MMYEITKGIPIPGNSKYPFELMQVGDSFAVPVPKNCDAGAHSAAVRSRCYVWSKKNSYKFVARLDEDRRAVRVWRIA